MRRPSWLAPTHAHGLTGEEERRQYPKCILWSVPKSAKSKPTIAIAPVVVEALRGYRRRQRKEHLALGPDWTDSGLVFTYEDGRGLHPDFILRSFQRDARRVGLPVISFHGLRHGAATAGLAAGVPLLAMSKRLGHSSVSITGDLYSHVVEHLDREAAERTAALMVPRAIQMTIR